MKIRTIQTLNTEFPADTVEWCPCEGYQSYLACGTYNLESNNVNESSSASSLCRRKGTIILLRYDEISEELFEVFRLSTPAILDMKWLPSPAADDSNPVLLPTLATANAHGEIVLYTLNAERLVFCTSISLDTNNENLLALSLDCDLQRKRSILASDSKGNISLLEYNIGRNDVTSPEIVITRTWNAHSFEAWICSFDKWNSNLCYSGGDDLMLHAYDLRTYERVLSNRSHGAGVTCLWSHKRRENILLTGSYDEHLRIFDTRNMRHPLSEINLEGGIWRLKEDPMQGDLILAACMYKNFSIIRMHSLNESDRITLDLQAVYNEHKSICYGADWCWNVGEKSDEINDLCMATCSFYDKKLCVSKVSLEDL